MVVEDPSGDDPNPEIGDPDEGADVEKGVGPSAHGSDFSHGLPGGGVAAWYFTVRIVLKDSDALKRLTGDAEVIICMQQIVYTSGKKHVAWLMNHSKLVLRDDLQAFVRRLRALLEQAGATLTGSGQTGGSSSSGSGGPAPSSGKHSRQ